MFLKTDTNSMTSHYAQVPAISHQRNSFSVAEKHVTTLAFDKLYPINWKYMYPGDTINVTSAMMARLTTQVSDLFDDLYFDIHAWFVPMRLIQTNWARYQFNAQPGGPSQDNSSLTSPKIDLATLWDAGGGNRQFQAKSTYDYWGLPTEINFNTIYTNTQHINNYLGRAYNLIWNTNYRDENLQNPVVVDLDDGPDDYNDYKTILTRGKRHDMITSSLPFLQKGTTPSIPVLGSAPVEASSVGAAPVWGLTNNGTTNYGLISANSSTGGGFSPTPGATGTAFWKTPNLTANLTSGLAFLTTNDLRLSVAVQHLLEGDARGGTRDVEAIKHRWGVTVPDFRLQRPEYLGGQTFTFDGHVVPSTADTVDNPQGHLTAFSQALNSFSITHSFVEHGVFMILLSLRSNITYQQGLQRELSHRTRLDWYQPEFSNLGEQALLIKEVAMTDVAALNDVAFGYQEYGYWLRYGWNRVSSEMRSNYATSKDYKHMAQEFTSITGLNAAFIQSFTPIDRNITVASSVADPVEINSLLKGNLVRTLPMYSIPGLTRL